jgi:hypothetical protein
MDCDEFKRRLLTDPMDADPAFRGHARHCPPCAAEAERALDFEAALRCVLAEEADRPGAAPVPAHRGRRWLLLGSLPLSAAVVWWMLHLATPLPGDSAGRALGRLAIAHVQAEPGLLDTAGNDPVSMGQLARLLHDLGADDLPRMTAGPILRHASRCRLGQADGAHLVMDGAVGPVTALVMPAAPATEPTSLHQDGLIALLLPHGPGAIALVGDTAEPLGDLARRLGLTPPP